MRGHAHPSSQNKSKAVAHEQTAQKKSVAPENEHPTAQFHAVAPSSPLPLQFAVPLTGGDREAALKAIGAFEVRKSMEKIIQKHGIFNDQNKSRFFLLYGDSLEAFERARSFVDGYEPHRQANLQRIQDLRLERANLEHLLHTMGHALRAKESDRGVMRQMLDDISTIPARLHMMQTAAAINSKDIDAMVIQEQGFKITSATIDAYIAMREARIARTKQNIAIRKEITALRNQRARAPELQADIEALSKHLAEEREIFSARRERHEAVLKELTECERLEDRYTGSKSSVNELAALSNRNIEDLIHEAVDACRLGAGTIEDNDAATRAKKKKAGAEYIIIYRPGRVVGRTNDGNFCTQVRVVLIPAGDGGYRVLTALPEPST